MRTITICRSALLRGEPAWVIDGVPAWGFSGVGTLDICTESRRAWMEFEGSLDPYEMGFFFACVPGEGELEEFKNLNLMIPGMHRRLEEDPSLVYGAVNRDRVLKGLPWACTLHTGYGTYLAPRLRLLGAVWSATVRPARRGEPEPLNAWVETQGVWEVPVAEGCPPLV